VLFDQRGSGRSHPPASGPEADLSSNTTSHLIDDIERLREHLGIDRWVVVGISWGVTLSLVYAQRHPERVISMVLGSVTTGTRRETNWITRDMGRVFPWEWEQFAAIVPASERDGDLAGAYARLLAHPDPQIRAQAALAWCSWEDTHVSLTPGWAPDPRYDDEVFRSVFARLVTHYWSHGCFLREDQIHNSMSRLSDIPAVLIHGRYAVSSPLARPGGCTAHGQQAASSSWTTPDTEEAASSGSLPPPSTRQRGERGSPAHRTSADTDGRSDGIGDLVPAGIDKRGELLGLFEPAGRVSAVGSRGPRW